ncbi:MAG: MFS transporter [Phycisphaerales bacterium]
MPPPPDATPAPQPPAGFYPLRGVAQPAQVWSWISFDVANQSFTLIINTLLFSIFFQEVVVTDPASKDTLWSLLFAVSMLLVVVASPVAGAIADGRCWKKKCLVGSGLLCAALTCCLGLIGPHQLWPAVLLYIPANFFFNIGENFLASFLPQLARQEEFGRVSGFSWGVAYSSALVMLLATAGAMVWLDLKQPAQWRPFFVAAGVWFFLFTVPTMLVLRERGPAPQPGNILAMGFRRLAESARATGSHKDLVTLLIASFFYGGAMCVIVSFASIIAQDFGFRDAALVGFIAVITVSGILGTLIPTFLQDRVGHKRMTIALLFVWLLTTAYLAWTAHQAASVPPGTDPPRWPVWLAGNLLGFGLGSLGTANRAFFGVMTPPSRSAEFFGVWGLVFKLAAVLVIPFGIAKDRFGMTASLAVLGGMVLAGLLVTLLVNEQRGTRAAREDAPAATPG